jgi:hypothetical protein
LFKAINETLKYNKLNYESENSSKAKSEEIRAKIKEI